MCSAVRIHDYEYPESEMDDRDSLYFDTISLAESEAAAAHRKSLSQSRNTVYHSAVDLVNDETPSKRGSFRSLKENVGRIWNYPNYRHSTTLEHYNGPAAGDYKSSTNAMQNSERAMYMNNDRHADGGIDIDSDEVSRRLLKISTCSIKDKKLPITYSQWKYRTRRRFQDGVRTVDFVLAYNGDDHKLENIRKREIFESNLIREGLQLEHDNTQRMHFIKLHVPLDVLCRYAEILKIKLPMKKIPGQDLIIDETFEFKTRIARIFRRLFSSVQLNTEKFPERPARIHFEFIRNYQHLYDMDHPNFFDAGTRNSIVNFILERQYFVEGVETPDNLGIEKLLEDGVYHSAYSLHDDTDRDRLLSEWANLSKWMNLQPLDYIKDYFGPKVALYYAWLGFYTHMLIPVSIIGVACFAYGLLTWNTDPISQQICNDNYTTIMCPQCDRSCDYWKLSETCESSKVNYLIDNNVTVVFAFVMAIWAVLYLELWKRYSAGLVHRWGLTDFSQHVEHPRPQYLAKIRKSKKLSAKVDTECNVLEPEVPFWTTKFLPNFTSYSIMVLFICISLIAISSMIIYRMAQRASHSILGNEDSMTYKIMVLPMTAGVIDLIVISVLGYVYSGLAVRLTDYEYCRTQTEYDESLTIKNYVFQFVNYYSSLFYIAFLKGKFVGYPAKYNRIFGFRQEECNPGGCLMELCMQLVIIMVGVPVVNAIVEMLIPYVMRTFRKIGSRYVGKRNSKEKLVSCNQWTEDFHLLPSENNSLYTEYLEMVLQYGFITLFGLAFPLAPLLALINNVIEMRLDAIKMLRFFRRPVAQRARKIGVWQGIINILTRMAVASSAMIIAFSTNLIPKLVYRTTTHDETLESYLNFTLAYFNTTDFQVEPVLPGSQLANVSVCRYTEFRNPPDHEMPYKRPMIYWKILTARLAFIVLYQNIIGMLQAVLRWSVPDVPGKLLKRIRRENFLVREHIIEYEKKTAAEKAALQQAYNELNKATTNNDESHYETTLDPLRKRANGKSEQLPIVEHEEPDDETTSV